MEDAEYVGWKEQQQHNHGASFPNVNDNRNEFHHGQSENHARPSDVQQYYEPVSQDINSNSNLVQERHRSTTDDTYAPYNTINSSATNYAQHMYPPYPMTLNGQQQFNEGTETLNGGGTFMVPRHNSLTPGSNIEDGPANTATQQSFPLQHQQSNGTLPHSHNMNTGSHGSFGYANNMMYNEYGQPIYQVYANPYGHQIPQMMHNTIPGYVLDHNGQQANQYSYNLTNGYQPYQRAEDALQRVHNNHFPQTMKQAQTLEQQNVNPQQVIQPKANKPIRAASPTRPIDTVEALKYDVSHCLNDYNTSRDPKGCTTALLSIMGTCDPPAVDSVITDTDKLKAEVAESKVKQIAVLGAVSNQIKGKMIEEISKNKSIRAKLRTWFVRAHKDNSYMVLKHTIKVLDKLTSLTEQHLAEVKFGKALLIVSRKCEDQEVKASLEKWVPKAQKSLEIEDELAKAAARAPPIEEEPKAKKAKVNPTAQSKSQSETKKTTKPSATIKKSDQPVAKLNTAFFKKEPSSAAAKIVAATKPGVSSVLKDIKVKKRTDVDKAAKPIESATTASSAPVDNSSTIATPKVQPVTPAFSAMKFVEGLKRGASPAPSADTQPDVKKRKQKKRVSWKPDAELEQIKEFETIEAEDGDEDVAHTPHEYGNARDLDRKEGAMLHSGFLHDRDEDFIDWESPKEIDFSHKDLAQGITTRGPKKAGSLVLKSAESETQAAREKEVFLAIYPSEEDIPKNPSETLALNEAAPHDPLFPKIIPLPAELRNNPRVQSVLGALADAGVAPPAIIAAAPVPAPITALPPPSIPGAPDIAAILASIAASQQATAATVPPMPMPMPPMPMSMPMPPMPMSMPMPPMPMPFQNQPGMPPMPMPMPNGGPGLADFLKSFQASNVPIQPQFQQQPQQSHQPHQRPGSSNGPLKDVRPWVTINTGGKYRDPCRFVALGKCEKGDACPYIHPQ